MYPFLDSFHKRMEQIAIHHFINEITNIKDALRGANLSKSQALNLLIQLLCFIMEKSLLEQACTLDDIRTFIEHTMKLQGYDIYEIDLEALTRYLVRDALQNGGKPYYFNAYNFVEDHEESYHVRLIEDKIIQIESKEVFSYSLTAQGYQFLFSTLEVEEALQMNFEQLRLKYAIQKRNFGSAKDSVDNLFTLNRKQIQKIKEYITQIKEDIGLFTSEDYALTYKATFDTLDEQKEKHVELYELITRTKEQYLAQHLTNYDAKLEDDLLHIDYIRSRLQQLLGEQLKLFKEQQTLGEVYDEAISNVLYIGFENRLNIEKDLLGVFEENPKSLNAMAKILKPLFLPKMKQQFNFVKAYSSQRIEADDDGSIQEEQFMEEIIDEEAERLHAGRLEYIQETYQVIIQRLLGAIKESSDGSIKLSQLFEKFDDVGLLRNVLIQLHGDYELNIDVIIHNSREHVFTATEDFDLSYTLSRVYKDHRFSKTIGIIRTTMLMDHIITIYSDHDKKYLRSYDLVFEKKKGQ